MNCSIERTIKANKGAIETLLTLSNSASFQVIMEGESFLFSRKEDSFIISNPSSNSAPDFTVSLPHSLFSAIFKHNSDNSKEFLINSAEILTESENKKHLSLSIHKSFFKLMSHRYFKLLTLGGRQFLLKLAESGLTDITTIRKKITSLTNSYRGQP